MQRKKLIYFFLIISTVLLLSSCYDSIEVDDMVYILAIGIDKTNTNDTQYTFQAAVPLNISSGVETGFAESEEEVTVQSITITSKDIFSAIESVNSKLAKEINVSHCKLVLFSVDLSTELFKNNICAINNYNEFSPDTLTALCQNKAIDYLDNISSPFEKNPARYYDIFFDKSFSLQSFSTPVSNFEKYKTLAIPLLDKDGTVKASIISNYKNILNLSHNETFALNSLTGSLNDGYITMENANISVSIKQISSPKIQVYKNGSFPHFKINLKYQGKIFANSPEDIKNKKKIEQYIEKECIKFLNKCTTYNKDVAGLINFSRPKFFTTKSFDNYDWENKFKNSHFEVVVDFKIIN